MKSYVRAAVGVAFIGGSVLAGSAAAASAGPRHSSRLIKTDMLTPVRAPFLGSTAIRGVLGGGAPWVIAEGEVELRADGEVKMEVEGLVIDPNFPNAAVAGINPVPTFKVTVSCLSTNAAGQTVTVNVSTDPAPADRAGNSELEAMVHLPSPCIDPIVFVANGGGNGAWFARTGG